MIEAHEVGVSQTENGDCSKTENSKQNAKTRVSNGGDY
jgi:hypothetical protein